MTGQADIPELAAELLRKYPLAKDSLFLQLGNLSVEVLSNRPEVIADLGDYYRLMSVESGGPAGLTIHALEAPAWDCGLDLAIKQPEPGKEKIKEEYLDLNGGRLVRKRLTGMVFLFGPDTNLALGPCLENPNQVINFINNRQLQKGLQQGALLAHAAGIAHHGKGLALAGQAGMGKSTLALHLMSRGAAFVSNDRLLVSRNGEGVFMEGVAKLPRINPGTALNNPHLQSVMPPGDHERFAALAPEKIWDLEHKYDVDVNACFGPGRINLAGPMHALAILDWARNGADTRVEEVDLAGRDDLLASFMKEPGVFYLPPEGQAQPGPDKYLAMLRGARCLAVSGGVDFDAAAGLLLARLEEM